MNYQSTSIRTNDHPVIMFSGTTFAPPENKILSYYRDVHDGAETMLELLWLTQLARQAYDSPRIGGGIDPEIATLGAGDSLENARAEDGSLASYIFGEVDAWDAPFKGVDTEHMRDMIVHAEAVARKWLAVYVPAGQEEWLEVFAND